MDAFPTSTASTASVHMDAAPSATVPPTELLPVSNAKANIAFASVCLLCISAAVIQAMQPVGAASEPATATATATATANANNNAALTVELVSPTVSNWPNTLQANGPVTAWQEGIVSAETGSLRITEILVDVGSAVRRGQLLARLSDTAIQADLLKQNAVVEQAKINMAQAQVNRQRATAVADIGALSAQKIDEYAFDEAIKRAALVSAEADKESTRIRLEQTRIVAVDSGVVTSRSAVLGNVVSTGTELFRIIRQGRLDWRAELDAQQLARVKVGQIAQLTLPDGHRAAGVVRMVAPTLSTSTGRATIYVSLLPQSGAQPGTFASGTIEIDHAPALTLPHTAVVLRDGRSDVYVLASAHVPVETVNRRTVLTGRRQGDRVEILSGLDAGAKVVASGGSFLSEGAKVRITPKKWLGGE